MFEIDAKKGNDENETSFFILLQLHYQNVIKNIIFFQLIKMLTLSEIYRLLKISNVSV